MLGRFPALTSSARAPGALQLHKLCGIADDSGSSAVCQGLCRALGPCMHEGLCILMPAYLFVRQGLKSAKVTMLGNHRIVYLEGTFEVTSGHLG